MVDIGTQERVDVVENLYLSVVLGISGGSSHGRHGKKTRAREIPLYGDTRTGGGRRVQPIELRRCHRRQCSWASKLLRRWIGVPNYINLS